MGSDKAESEKLKVTKRKVEQQLKKENIQVKIAETNQKLEKENAEKERAVWMKSWSNVDRIRRFYLYRNHRNHSQKRKNHREFADFLKHKFRKTNWREFKNGKIENSR